MPRNPSFDHFFRRMGMEAEVRFAPPRRWRFDWATNDGSKIAVEIEGGVWTGGRHTRGSGFIKDMEKYNTAVLLGWRVLRYTPSQVRTEAGRIEDAVNTLRGGQDD